ncbi:MAG: hybrid sensor histidine kinase/response regulator [Desulfatitalea sp.]
MGDMMSTMEKTPSAIGPSPAAPTALEEAKQVLFIDDDENILKALKRVLRAEPFRLHLATSGAEALALLEREAIQVVITDISMPVMDGLKLLEEVARRYPETVRMVLSGRSGTATIIEAVNAGRIYRYILKPWDDDDLKINVHHALALHTLQSERNRMLDLLQEHNKMLEERVAERTRQALAFERQAEIGRYAAQIVHNLNNPLHALTAAIDLLSIYVAGGRLHKDEMEKYLALAGKATMDLTAMVAGILAHARQEKSSVRQPLDLNQMIQSELKFMEMVPEFKHKIKRKVHLDPALPRVMGNPIEIKQILDNLIKNALDAMAHSPEKRLTVQTHAEVGYALIEVADTGEGIEPAHYDRIFAPDFTTKPPGKGTGLGLASVKTMVDSYGGRIDFHSEQGKGTTFRVCLPASYKSMISNEKGNTL